MELQGLDQRCRVLDRLVGQVALGVERLHKAGISQVVIGTDHGFLYLPSELEPDKVDAPAQDPNVDRHRRYLVGRPENHPDLLFLSASDVGLGGSQDRSPFPKD